MTRAEKNAPQRKRQTKAERTTVSASTPSHSARVKLFIIPVLIGVVLIFAFPEIGNFLFGSISGVVSTIRLSLRKQPSNATISNGVINMTKDEQPNTANPTNEPTGPPTPVQVNKNDNIPAEVKDFKPTFQRELKTKKIFLEGRRIAPVELLPQSNVSSSHSTRLVVCLLYLP